MILKWFYCRPSFTQKIQVNPCFFKFLEFQNLDIQMIVGPLSYKDLKVRIKDQLKFAQLGCDSTFKGYYLLFTKCLFGRSMKVKGQPVCLKTINRVLNYYCIKYTIKIIMNIESKYFFKAYHRSLFKFGNISESKFFI